MMFCKKDLPAVPGFAFCLQRRLCILSAVQASRSARRREKGYAKIRKNLIILI